MINDPRPNLITKRSKNIFFFHYAYKFHMYDHVIDFFHVNLLLEGFVHSLVLLEKNVL
jgi:hypothetical protein